jgi:hypothetical protein
MNQTNVHVQKKKKEQCKSVIFKYWRGLIWLKERDVIVTDYNDVFFVI